MLDGIQKLTYRVKANIPNAAAAILGNSESAARNTLRSLVKKGYLTEDMSKVPFIYSLDQHLPL